MYVCLCNGYRDGDIREMAESGVRCAREAYMALGSGPRCGACLPCAQDIVDAVHSPEKPAHEIQAPEFLAAE
ncbi:hypothetical protein HBA54_15915 [Pelagibius litoralis]|uniref:Bacterioferritin-associated ferredoxin n=1 Tax=Pelagibius litoralis TaxID=374515 RepID=A0A967K9T7_9PROT|nr:(2Fe-2S)-binding protein [Pelagibius litoralis]NIA70092.1 hypothetical protein [Pelagibius litoralis]